MIQKVQLMITLSVYKEEIFELMLKDEQELTR